MPVNAMKRYLALFLTLCLILCSCAPGGSNSSVSDKNPHPNTSFQEYTDALFRESVSSDALSLNYSLAHPENYRISKTAGGFPALSVSETAQASSEYENALAKLESFDRTSLGAIRYHRDVESKIKTGKGPDILFLEFAVNDREDILRGAYFVFDLLQMKNKRRIWLQH